MNMMTEVDILLIKQIELKYLTKIKKLLYLLAVAGIKAPNISQLAHDIETSEGHGDELHRVSLRGQIVEYHLSGWAKVSQEAWQKL